MDPDINMLSFTLSIAFFIVFVLLVVFLFFLKRIKGGPLNVRRNQIMKNLATLSLGPKRSIALVEVCDEWILLGVGAENVSLISKIEKPSDLSQFESTAGNGFDSFLSRAGLAGISLKKKSSDKNE